MSPTLVALCYGSALLLALLILWYFGAKHWYWHLLAIIAAFAIGLTPLPEAWNAPARTLLVGWAFFFLFVWGLAAPIFALAHHPPHLGHHPH